MSNRPLSRNRNHVWMGIGLSLMLFPACSSTDLYLEVEGHHIAESAGVEVKDLKFITNADIVETALPDQSEEEQIPMEAAPHSFSPYTKGFVAVSNDRLFWAHEDVEHVESEDFLSVPVSEIEAVQRIPENTLLVRTTTQDIIIRPHSWTKYAGDDVRLNMLWTALADRGVDVIFTREELLHQVPPKERPSEAVSPAESSSPSFDIPNPWATDETGRM